MGHIQKVYEFLMESSIDPSYCDSNAIRLASREGNLQIVQLLLKDSRVDASALDNQAIRWASFHGHVAVVNILADHLGLDNDQDFGPIVIINADRDSW